MRTARLALLAIVALAATPSCSPPAAEASISVMALGDTARLTFHWGAVTKATGYTYTISTLATNGTWVGLPTNAVTTATSGTAIATSATADTAVFQLCATATGLGSPSSAGCTASTQTTANTWRRKLATPQPVLDSVNVSLVPNPVSVTLAASRMLCAFLGFKDGQVAERTTDKASCDSLYVQAFPAAQRVPTAPEQRLADTSTWGWSTNNAASVGLVPQGLGSSAVLVQGNGLTMLGRVEPLEHYAAADPGPVYRVDSTYVTPDGSAGVAVTCLRPGRQFLLASAEGAGTRFEVVCHPSPAMLRIAADVLFVRPDVLSPHRA